MTIEALLVWAYRDQMVHAARAEGMPAEITLGYSPGMAQMQFVGEGVQSSVKCDFEAAPDAYAVHRAVMKLPQIERDASAEERECLFARWSVAADLRAAQGPVVLHDARAIRAKLFGQKAEMVDLKSLVFEWAMKAQRPDWCPLPLYEWRRGATFYDKRSHRALFRLVDPVGDDPIDVERARVTYGLWVYALKSLRDSLACDGVLRDHRLMEWLPSAVPWIAA